MKNFSDTVWKRLISCKSTAKRTDLCFAHVTKLHEAYLTMTILSLPALHLKVKL